MSIFSVTAVKLIDSVCSKAIMSSKAEDASLLTTVGNFVGSIVGAHVRNTTLSNEKQRIVEELKAKLNELELSESKDDDDQTLQKLQQLISDHRDEVIAATKNPRFTGSDKTVSGTTEQWLGDLRDTLLDIQRQLANLPFVTEENIESPRTKFEYLIGFYYANKLFREKTNKEETSSFLAAEEKLINTICRKYREETRTIDETAPEKTTNKLYNISVYMHIKAIVLLLQNEHRALMNAHKEEPNQNCLAIETATLCNILEAGLTKTDITDTLSIRSSSSSWRSNSISNPQERQLFKLPAHTRKYFRKEERDSIRTNSTTFEENEQIASTPPSNTALPAQKQLKEREQHLLKEAPKTSDKIFNDKSASSPAEDDPIESSSAAMPIPPDTNTGEEPAISGEPPVEQDGLRNVTDMSITTLSAAQNESCGEEPPVSSQPPANNDDEQANPQDINTAAMSLLQQECKQKELPLNPAHLEAQNEPLNSQESNAAPTLIEHEERKDETAPKESPQNLTDSTASMLQHLSEKPDSKKDIVVDVIPENPAHHEPPLSKKAQKKAQKKLEEQLKTEKPASARNEEHADLSQPSASNK